ncbi:MAG: Lrp/AsnC family transcriptional regulator [Candidatus Thorarchaeota archaeon]
MDELDKSLIKLLQRDARMPFTQIGKELEQPDTTIHFRTRKLRENNIVTRFSALVRPEAVGFTSAAIFTIEVGGHILPDISKDRAVTFAEELAEDEQYLWIAVDREPMRIHAMAMGETDEDLEARAEQLKKSPDIVNVTVLPVGKVVKGWEISGWPQ